MFSPDQYQLLDFGAGRKLERFGRWLLDRPAPAAEPFAKLAPNAWSAVDARFERAGDQTGRWLPADRLPPHWNVRHDPWVLQLQPTPFGHVGLFPEQAANWDWIDHCVRSVGGPLQVLNLFAYTGGSTLAAAAAGAEVTHVDAARNVVQWARQNAQASGLEQAPIRWIAEDALKFVHRELRRGRQYQAVILDPPSYGHGPKGQVWKLDQQLEELLIACGELTRRQRAFILLTCHTEGYDPARLRQCLRSCLSGPPGHIESFDLELTDSQGRRLPSGVVARWTALRATDA